MKRKRWTKNFVVISVDNRQCDTPLQAHYRLAQFEAPPLLYCWLEEASGWSSPFWLEQKANPRVSSSPVFSASHGPAPWKQNRARQFWKWTYRALTHRVWDQHHICVPGKIWGSQNKHQVVRACQSIHLNQELCLHPPAAFMLTSYGKNSKRW